MLKDAATTLLTVFILYRVQHNILRIFWASLSVCLVFVIFLRLVYVCLQAIEFLSRIEAYRSHAVHFAIVIYLRKLLIVPETVQAQLCKWITTLRWHFSPDMREISAWYMSHIRICAGEKRHKNFLVWNHLNGSSLAFDWDIHGSVVQSLVILTLDEYKIQKKVFLQQSCLVDSSFGLWRFEIKRTYRYTET